MSLWGQPGIFGPQPGSLSFQTIPRGQVKKPNLISALTHA